MTRNTREQSPITTKHNVWFCTKCIGMAIEEATTKTPNCDTCSTKMVKSGSIEVVEDEEGTG